MTLDEIRDFLFPPPYPERQKVVVTTKQDESFRGILWKRRRDYLVLRSVEILHGRETPVPVAGEFMFLMTEVQYIQVLYGAS